MTKRAFVISSATLLVALVAGCGTVPQGLAGAQLRGTQAYGAQRLKPAPAPAHDKSAKDAFAAAVKSHGITLTDDQLAEIQAERDAVPSGVWAPRPAANLTADQNLQVHFLKHGAEFRPALPTAEAYLAQGNAAGSGKRGTVRFFFDTTSFDKGYQSHVVRWVPTTHDFTAFRADGAETTYYQNDPQPSRFVEVPAW